MSKSEIADILTQGNIYARRDMAMERLSDAWTELRMRAILLGKSAPYSIKIRRIVKTKSWESVAAHSFCLLLSYSIWNSNWSSTFGTDYTTQGLLFEEMTKEAIDLVFTGWRAHVTGWSRTRINGLSAVVEDVANHLGEPMCHSERWNRERGKDAGLDLLLYRPFHDDKVGVPVYMIQCASGGNFEEKMNTPNIYLWSRLVEFSALPKRAFSTPIAFPQEEFHNYCVRVNGPIFDRYRLLSAGHKKASWLSANLKKQIVKWANPRVKSLAAL